MTALLAWLSAKAGLLSGPQFSHLLKEEVEVAHPCHVYMSFKPQKVSHRYNLNFLAASHIKRNKKGELILMMYFI